MANEVKIAAIEYAIKGLERAKNSTKSEVIKGVYQKDLDELETWKSQIKAGK